MRGWLMAAVMLVISHAIATRLPKKVIVVSALVTINAIIITPATPQQVQNVTLFNSHKEALEITNHSVGFLTLPWDR